MIALRSTSNTMADHLEPSPPKRRRVASPPLCAFQQSFFEDSSLKKALLNRGRESYSVVRDGTQSLELLFSALGSTDAIEEVHITGTFLGQLFAHECHRLFRLLGGIPLLHRIEVSTAAVPFASLLEVVGHAKSVTKVSLREVSLYAVEGAGHHLRDHPSLESFSMENFTFDDEDVDLESLIMALSSCSHLSRVSLSDYNVFEFSYVAGDMPWSMDSLHELLSKRKLEHLSLSLLDIPDTQALARSLASCPSLKSLYLRANDMETEGCMSVIQAVAPFIRTLDLRGNDITPEGCELLARDALPKCQVLEELNLSYNPICDQGTQALTTTLCQLPLLRQLHFTKCGLTEAGSRHLIASLSPYMALNIGEDHLPKPCYSTFVQALNKSQGFRLTKIFASSEPLEPLLREKNLLEREEPSTDEWTQNLDVSLRLNRALRRHSNWVDVMTELSDDATALLFVLRANPSLFH